jgi:hypothetical protein
MGKLLNFLFGRSPDIFDDKGNVVHKLPANLWQSWRDRFEKNPEYDGRKHHGTERVVRKPKN